VRLLEDAAPLQPDRPHIVEACGPQVYTLAELVRLAGRLSGVAHGHGRPIIPLPLWLGRVQAALMELSLGEPLMSRDNIASMQVDNVASGSVPGLEALGIQPAPLEPIARRYLAHS
jgi:NADH dehydrogenase